MSRDGHPLRIGLVGCGKWGKLILRDLRALGCDVVAVARSPESVARAEAGGAIDVVDDVQNLPRDLDGYVVAAVTSQHFELTRALCDRGPPIFVEKPLALSRAHVQELIDLAPGRIFTMHKWRYHPGVRDLRNIVDRGDWGAVTHIDLKRLGWGCNHDDVDAVWVLLPHDMSIALHVLGELPPPLHAVGERDGVGAPCGLTGALVADGVEMRVEVSSRWPTRLRIVRVAFERGVAILEDRFARDANRPAMSYRLTVHDGDGRAPDNSQTPVELPMRDEMPLLLELEAFLNYLRGGPPPMSRAEESLTLVSHIQTLRQMAGFDESG